LPNVDPKTEEEVGDLETIDFDNMPSDWVNRLLKAHKYVFLDNRVKIIGFDFDRFDQIYKSVMNLVINKKCVDAFVAANIPTALDVIKSKGMAFIYFTDNLSLTKELEGIGISSKLLKDMRAHQNFGSDATTPDSKVYPELKTAVTFLYNWTFTERRNYPFEETMPHEQMHRSGLSREWAWYQHTPIFYVGHDLTGNENYNKIIEACKPPF
jgi:hypothetical protein